MLTIIGISLLVGIITFFSYILIRVLGHFIKFTFKYVLPIVALICIAVLLSWPALILLAIIFAIIFTIRDKWSYNSPNVV